MTSDKQLEHWKKIVVKDYVKRLGTNGAGFLSDTLKTALISDIVLDLANGLDDESTARLTVDSFIEVRKRALIHVGLWD